MPKSKQTPAQKRKAVARKLERASTPANPKVKAGDVTLSPAAVREAIRALKS